MSRIFGVYDLRQNEVREGLSLRERGALQNGRSKDGHLFAPGHRHAVLRVLGAGIHGSHDDEHVLELGAYPSRAER